MPAWLINALKQSASKTMGKGKAPQGHYVYGAMNNMGLMKGNQETAKGLKFAQKFPMGPK